MAHSKHLLALGGGLLLGAASMVHADAIPSNSTQTDAMQARINQLEGHIAQLQGQVADLQGQQNDSWLNEKRAAEVKALVRDVLADADTRASMAEAGATAGYNNGFFLASEDGKFLLTIGGQLQARYTYNAREGKQKNLLAPPAFAKVEDKNDGYFTLPRTKISADGHIGNPNINYHLLVAAKPVGDDPGYDTSEPIVQEVVLSYQFADGINLWAGRKATPLVRDQFLDSRNLLMADRGALSSAFGYGRPTGVGVDYDYSDALHFQASGFDYSTDTHSFGVLAPATGGYGVVARADWKLKGDWAQANDFSSWSGNDELLIVGASGAFAQLDHGVTNATNSEVTFGLDGLYQNNGFSLYLAGMTRSINMTNASAQLTGFAVQGSYMVVADKFEPFARYDFLYLNHDGGDVVYGLKTQPNANRTHLITLGANYYLAKHAAKFTVDVQYAPTGQQGELGANTSGMLQDYLHNKNQVALRGQFQLLF